MLLLKTEYVNRLCFLPWWHYIQFRIKSYWFFRRWGYYSWWKYWWS